LEELTKVESRLSSSEMTYSCADSVFGAHSGFTERDNEEAPDAVIIDEELARRFYPNEDPVGKRLQVGMEKTRWRENVGVVVNAKLSGLEAKTDPAIYVPFRQNTWPNALRTSFLVVRTDGDPNNYRAAIRQALLSQDR
jgi:putative ABC transport system permease protein